VGGGGEGLIKGDEGKVGGGVDSSGGENVEGIAGVKVGGKMEDGR